MNTSDSSELIHLLNEALARELHVSVQYMMQHAVGIGRGVVSSGKTAAAMQNKFVASHAMVFLPGKSLKKTAIAEMRHAEAIAERIVILGGEPVTDPGDITLGSSVKEMLAIDKGMELEAIELYERIIGFASRID
ncbi:MAG TPA: ferritin-like domain-containing protein, partial [Anaerolineaceae bacterium]|nr:ferritin-like domain-containing protein [Anaerolineaceae bacterium]